MACLRVSHEGTHAFSVTNIVTLTSSFNRINFIRFLQIICKDICKYEGRKF